MVMPSDLTEQHLLIFSILERTCSAFSLLGCAYVAASFLYVKSFREKPINRLIFYASIGNVFTNVATIIARGAVNKPLGGMCQFQAFLIQMFMSADAYWTLAMACNVYLTFFFKFDMDKIRRIEPYYFLFCYGIPFIPAFVYLFIKTSVKGHMYGNATLWCWVGGNWDVFRVATFYGPIWVVISLTCMVYLRAGREIYRKRAALRKFDVVSIDPVLLLADPFTSMKTTEVSVTSEAALASPDSLEPVKIPAPAYSVKVSAPGRSFEPIHSASQDRAEKGLHRTNTNATSGPYPPYMPKTNSRTQSIRHVAVRSADSALWSYAKVSGLFFLAMMLTWVPSTANRTWSVVHNGDVNLPLGYAASIVLPLQGFWNAFIYTVTNIRSVEILIAKLSRKDAAPVSEDDSEFWGVRNPFRNIFKSRFHGSSKTANGQDGGGQRKDSETESTTELQSRPNTISNGH
ncbi:putative cAMP receptor-like protein [Calycina marina]|uniref:cAMP receptor-like protein n=1 Tax=Calycina marina TaxID=1763456 RepID=A0A9P7YYR7_9HELO|nr:putative cAMP receptor-like protein [Calycina marina]